jgi:hypothetical protein
VPTGLDGPDPAHRHNGLGRPPWAGLEAPLYFPPPVWVNKAEPSEDGRSGLGRSPHQRCKCVIYAGP